jgi:poly-gamma-glutamate synthesis protein (capsule biosynthesis protein)
LETSITASNAFLPKGINYRMHPRNLRCLTAAGVDCCVLANNHVLDWGESGLVETLQVLRGAGIGTAGAGMNEAEAQAPAIFGLERVPISWKHKRHPRNRPPRSRCGTPQARSA